jgi:dimethylamine corrinoid protein
MAKTIQALRSAGLSAKVIIGGCPITPEVCEQVGADAWATNPQEGVKICVEWARA